MKEKICPSCGAQFQCFADTNETCWCANYEIAPENLEKLTKEYSGCLCETCLAKFSAQQNK